MKRMPPRPTQSGAFFDWCRQIHDLLESLLPLHSRGARRTGTPRGFFIEAQPSRGGGAGGSPIIAGALTDFYRGDFHTSLSYNTRDKVTVRGGDNSGLYIATVAIAPGGAEPGTAGASGWVKIADVDQVTVWK